MLNKAGGSSGLLMDLAANEKDVHADFFNGTLTAFRFVEILENICNFSFHFDVLRIEFEDLCDEDEETAASS